MREVVYILNTNLSDSIDVYVKKPQVLLSSVGFLYNLFELINLHKEAT